MTSQRESRCRVAASFALAWALLLLPTAAAGAEPVWLPVPALADVRFGGSTDVTADVLADGARVALPFVVDVGGDRYDLLLVGLGTARFGASGETCSGDQGSGLVDPDGTRLCLGPTIDVLAGDGIHADPALRVLVADAGMGIAVRWVGLRASESSGSSAIAELLIERSGLITVQYLHVPAVASAEILAGRARALSVSSDAARSFSLRGPVPASATAFRLVGPAEVGAALPPSGEIGPLAGGPPPAGCNPETGTWCSRAGTDCALAAGTAGLTPCTTTVATTWAFNEGAYCRGCTYTFYVLVECGREMHIPVFDMEGMELTISDVLTGATPPLRCVNDAARGNAPQVLRCVGPGGRTGFGPPFDETSNDGTISWGFPDCVSVPDLTCDDIPAGGGTVTRLSPGELQTMDCWIEAASGLCGLYRVDVRSGGFEWQLFANCDGTSSPQFQLYTDCTAAWAAFAPLPEIAVANITSIGNCPDLQVGFDVQNLGCSDHVGGVTVRISSNCVPPNVVNHVVTATIPANGSVSVSVPFTVSCDPVRIDILIDPANAVAECTESATVSACRASPGVDTLSAFACGCTAQLTAEAGPDRAACAGDTVVLDASASSIAPCAEPRYRWLDAAGVPLAPASSSPTLPVTFDGCPGDAEYTLEVSCGTELCLDVDTVTIACLAPVADAGPDIVACAGDPTILSVAASGVAGCAQPLYRWLDSTGAEIQAWGPDAELDLGPMDCALAGTYRLEVGCAGGATCTAIDDIVLGCVEIVPDAGADVPACDGVPFTIAPAPAASTGCTSIVYRWLDAGFAPLTTFGPTPEFTWVLGGCPGRVTLILEAACADGAIPSCSAFDFVDVLCEAGETPLPSSSDRCGPPSADLACGLATPGTFWWDTDLATDSDGNTVPDDDADLAGCDGTASWVSPGSRTVRAFSRGPSGCLAFADLVVDAQGDPAPPLAVATPGCPGEPGALTCGTSLPGASYSWDFDLASDSDGNGMPDDDVDAATCNAAPSYPEGSHVARVTVTDARGCSSSTTLAFDVVANARPGEAQDLRVSRQGAALTFDWQPAVAASTYRVVRGNIGTWYDHAVDDTVGRGACDTLGALAFTDPDDALGPDDWYYLVLGVSSCGGGLGTAGFGMSDAPFERPAPVPTASCP